MHRRRIQRGRRRHQSWLPPAAMALLLAATPLVPRRLGFAAAAAAAPPPLLRRGGGSSSSSGGDGSSDAITYRTVRAHVVHRHGDRTPITPLRDEAPWYKALVPEATARRIAERTAVVAAAPDQAHVAHAAAGRGPFGRLTELGLLQMVRLGATLRERFAAVQRHAQPGGAPPLQIGPLGVLQPVDLQVYCTDFERTIQSVQGLLVGLLPDEEEGPAPVPALALDDPAAVVAIDTRHTAWMIPDPQPRRTPEQARLERDLATRPHVRAREEELRPLAARATAALAPLLALDAHRIAFGVDETEPGQQEVELQPLGWNQLAEVTKCLAVRGLLPPGLSAEDQEAIAAHAAWRWFENLHDERLVYLAMNKMARTMLESLGDSSSKRLTIWSAHDSTLMGLLCAFRLEMPAHWPEYASSLVIELIEAKRGSGGEDHFVRFSLNGEQLSCEWEDQEAMDLVPMEFLVEKICKEHQTTTSQ